MQLSNIQIPLQARSHWSAVDLGFTLARHWWLPLFLVWLIPSMCLYLVLLFAFSDLPWISLLVAWWLKPYWDQLSLYMGSRLIFGEQIGVVQTLRKSFSIIRKDWWQWITFRRLSTTRSFDMPITTLEQLGGSVRAARKTVLHQSASSAPFWLTVLTLHLEYILVYGLLALLYLMLPDHMELDWAGMFQIEPTWVSLVSNTLFCLSMAALAPFYTMSGFVLYLNRRIELEGWDIELQFRHLAEHSSKNHEKLKGLSVALLIGCLVIGAVPDPASASQGIYQTDSLTLEESNKVVAEILDGESFHQQKTIRKWQRKNLQKVEEKNSNIPKWLISFVKFVERIAKSIAGLGTVLEVLFWAGFAFIVIFLVYRFRKEISGAIGYFRKNPTAKETPKVLFGLDVSEENLPDDILTEAKSLWGADQKRDAVGLLYRASLSRLIRDYACPFHSSDTESECVEKVDRLGLAPVSGFIAALTDSWQRIAYGHLEIPPEQFTQLCDRWEQVLA